MKVTGIKYWTVLCLRLLRCVFSCTPSRLGSFWEVAGNKSLKEEWSLG